MTVDIRARVTCSAGTLLSASISDDYIQGSGLIKTSGSCELAGVYSLNPGDRVTFSYSKAGITRSVPRVLRVLSSFADPFRRITSVQLGCKLTYLQDLTDPINWDAFDDPENAGRTEEEQTIVTIPIYAKSIMQKCLQELGITATSNPLTNRFSISEFDFSSGYVNILSDLLVSESYCGYLNTDEELAIIDLSVDGGSGPVVGSSQIIDVGPIGVGQLPGDAVVVTYSTLKLKAPDGAELQPSTGGSGSGGTNELLSGDDVEFNSSTTEVSISYEDPTTRESRNRIYNSFTERRTTTTYTLLSIVNSDGSVTRKNVVSKRFKTIGETTVAIAGNLYSDYLSAGIPFNAFQANSYEESFFTYDNFGNQIREEKTEYANAIKELGILGIKYVYSDGPVSINNFAYPVKKEVISTQRFGSYERSTRETYITWSRTIAGQQAIARASDYLRTSVQASEFINSIYRGGLVLVDQTVDGSITGFRGQEAPLPGDITNSINADTTNAGSNFTTEEKSEIELVTGSSEAQRRVEFSLPYAPDDIFRRVGGSYFSSKSDASQKANKFGRIQNRMLLGNRSGMNIQIAPESIPNEPFSAIFIEANGIVALYRTNGTSWTIDQNGIIASTDAMFWGTAGKMT